jgi:ADP-ribosyl-[dinitrogen reductase] hydrolase
MLPSSADDRVRPTHEPELHQTNLWDRAAGALIGGAVGDALGVPYEFAAPPAPGREPVMSGGGLGNFEPGEWSDDTAMALAVAQAAATHRDLLTVPALDEVAAGFLAWFGDGPADIGNQTRVVLGAAATGGDTGASREVGRGARMTSEAYAYAVAQPHSAGNGALMRTGPVALAHLDDRGACAEAARCVASLTHADPLAGDSCVLWSEAVRVAITEERFEISAGLDLIPADRRGDWANWLSQASHSHPDDGAVPGSRFRPNGYTVTALQAATAAVMLTPVSNSDPPRHFADAIQAAVRIGDDTDTVAAIAGALLGARWGASAIRAEWQEAVHGWPGLDATDLGDLANRICG